MLLLSMLIYNWEGQILILYMTDWGFLMGLFYIRMQTLHSGLLGIELQIKEKIVTSLATQQQSVLGQKITKTRQESKIMAFCIFTTRQGLLKVLSICFTLF